ncbi:tripartite tricarboxylate transporter substrate binding protein [Bradyrhizobium sp. LA6.7]|uniref:Bug family tripartite tricarboxylate transporter substrate binding protein n=1 Tax=unclassified Bradyrhizobium TaxID=2631580 RepID=UPI003391A1F0
MLRRTFMAAAGCLALTMPSLAQSKVTRIIVAFAPGGPVDSVARIVADQLGKELGRTVIVENKPGANGTIGAQEVMKSAPDGSTIWITSVGATAINPSLYEKLPYDMTRDFAPVSMVVNNVEVLVINTTDRAKDAAEFVANAKLTKETPMASSGVGSIPHLAIEQLSDATGATFLHVPYRGAAPALSDVMGGQVAGFFGDVPGLIGHVKGGKLRAVGVAAPTRHPALPDVKTFEEQGLKGIDTNNWYALFVSSKTSPDVVESLNNKVRAALTNPGVKAKLSAMGAEPAPSTPAELAAVLKKDTEKWAALIRVKGIKGE